MAGTLKNTIRGLINALQDALKDKSLPQTTRDHIDALDADLNKTWKDLETNPEDIADQGADENTEKEAAIDPKVGGGVDRDKIPAEDFAGKNRSYPIVKPGDISDAASSIGQAGADNYSSDQLKTNIIKIAKRKGASFVAELPKVWTDEPTKESAVFESDYIPLVEKAVRSDGSISVKLIRPGWGSSGFYSPEVLQRDGPKVFAKGTKCYWDHPTPTEEAERPERSLRDLAAELVTPARWIENATTGPGLYADAKVFEPYKEAVNDLGPHIGMSIRAMGRAESGKAEGKNGPIISEISAARSVDFVTEPGAGGQILTLFEARRNAAHIPTQQGDEDMVELDALKESNAQLEKKLADQGALVARLQEGMMLREAEKVAAEALSASALPIVTQKRLTPILSKAAPTKDGKLDLTAFQTAITEMIKSETAYLVEVTGSGQITGMGSTTVETKPEDDLKAMTEAYVAMGYSEAVAGRMAKGR